PRLAALEEYVMGAANTLGIGTMGFGGGVTLIGCKIGALNRLPASFFVSVAYDCWAFRRLGVVLDASTGEIKRWLYRDEAKQPERMSSGEGFKLYGSEKAVQAPITEELVRSLAVGDVVLITGEMYTGRDAVHSYLMKHEPPADLSGSVLYHCGPVVMKNNGGFRVTAARPTTSKTGKAYPARTIKHLCRLAPRRRGGHGQRAQAGWQERGA